jgi:hypothetical protein
MALAVLGVGVVGSQAGHLVAYELRFGSAAQQLQSSGAHAYFPLLAKTTVGAVAAIFLAGIFMIGLARMLTTRACLQTNAGPSFIPLLAALFTIQLACFMIQEAEEALVVGTAVDSAPHLMLWGALGQLPVAALAAIALGWFGKRFASAIGGLRAMFAVEHGRRPPASAAVALWPVSDRARLLSRVAGGSLAKRGPPSSLRFSS